MDSLEIFVVFTNQHDDRWYIFISRCYLKFPINIVADDNSKNKQTERPKQLYNIEMPNASSM